MSITYRLLKKEEFSSVYKLMQASFPPAELRSFQDAITLFSNPSYRILIAEKNKIIEAFIAEWCFEKFHYIEHFAVHPKTRGNGLGSKIMREYQKQLNCPVIIEVEAFATKESKRRISFYERLDFKLSDIKYLQPILQKNTKSVPLCLMCYPSSIEKEALLNMKDYIFEFVYRL
ncbi:ribosomal protein S18 acetylase RimI-like enzyme [Lachnotalea glycerini]|nr:GNAT family N-acetyltransferase [Lachnotalea glycerini]PXV84889.1 ribosomal protein S18 acetylase RimI-like enzyme [Lachnotalea glycerini]